MNTILFYSVSEPYGCFSNFARYPIKLDGDVWATSEHYFQAAKFLNESDRQAVQSAKSSLMAARIATHGADLVEHTKNDSYWGDGGDGSGRNQLGKLLVQLRNDYIEHKFDVGVVSEIGRYSEQLNASLAAANSHGASSDIFLEFRDAVVGCCEIRL